ncbi:octanoyltransferase [Thiorhodovibrio winogradskyi]|nr:octanoyltransferase [Thiorhodovibrio winogradskyi]
MEAPVVRQCGRCAYQETFEQMRAFTDTRDAQTRDELWVVEHDPVLTLGQAGRREHLLNPGTIPIIDSDRGGQVTYHGPGQVVIYVLLDLRRRGLGVRQLVSLLEQSVIAALAAEGINATTRAGAPGVYVDDAKIAALGLRVRRGCSYHGLALNVSMDLAPFSRIDPCGYRGLRVTQVADLGCELAKEQAASALVDQLCARLGSP